MDVFLTPGVKGNPIVGVQRPLIVPAPSAATGVTLLLPGGSWWRLLTANVLFITSAVVGNRFLQAGYADGARNLYRYGPPIAVTASLVTDVNIAPGIPAGASLGVAASLVLPFPDIILPGGYTLFIRGVSMDAADLFTESSWFFEELDQGPYGAVLGRVPVSDSDTST